MQRGEISEKFLEVDQNFYYPQMEIRKINYYGNKKIKNNSKVMLIKSRKSCSLRYIIFIFINNVLLNIKISLLK